MLQTILIIVVRHVLSLRESSETDYTHFLLQFKNLNFFSYLLLIRATLRKPFSILLKMKGPFFTDTL
jgi:hypothetical protein